MFAVTLRIRIEWAHCDPAGIIYNPHYYAWMDQGTHQLLHAVDIALFELARTTEFRGCALVASGAEFIRPAELGDIITLHTRAREFGNKSFTFEHEFRRGEDTLATGHEVRVWTGTGACGELIAVPVPEYVKSRLRQPGSRDVTP